MRVFLDDMRDTPPGWVRTFTPEETIDLLETGEVTEVSLDFDLGLEEPDIERNGYTVLAWLEREIADRRPVAVPTPADRGSQREPARPLAHAASDRRDKAVARRVTYAWAMSRSNSK